MKTILGEIVAWLASATVFAAGSVAGTLIHAVFSPDAAAGNPINTIGLSSMVVSAALAVLTWRLLERRWITTRELTQPRRSIRLGIVALYLLTWMFGVPAVQTELVLDTFERSSGAELRQVVISPGPSFPLFPAVILTYYEYQGAPLDGWGGWSVHVWHATGAKRVLRWRLWAS